jgi:hypothetical protein
MRFLFVSASEVDELSPEEDVCIQEVVNYLMHAYPDLITLEHLHKFGFEPNLGSSPSFFLCRLWSNLVFSFSPFSLLFSLLFSLFFLYIYIYIYIYIYD